MLSSQCWKMVLAGALAGAVNGLFGAGGGMVLIPLLTVLTPIRDADLFPASVSIILPICLVSILGTIITGGIAWSDSLPYLSGSAIGGLAAGLFGKRIPAIWLHRSFGIFILWGGIRYLC